MVNAPRQSSLSAEHSRGKLPFARTYCLLLVCLPLVLIPAFIALGASDFFLHHGASVWVQANDQVFNTRNRECDALIFGDSTAMTGIDPARVEQQTGFRTCNIAVTNAVLTVSGNLTLDRFLANNPRPKVLLIQFAPEGFQPEAHSWHHSVYAEGMLEMLRHAPASESRRMLLQHPQDAVGFAGYVAGFSAWYLIKDAWFHATSRRAAEDTIVLRNGFFTPPAPPRTTCEQAGALLPQPTADRIAFSRALIADYQASYAGRAAVVLVNVAPIPECDQNLAAYSAELRGLTSNSLLPMPVGYFNNCCHYTAQGSEIVSGLIARELNVVAHQHPPNARLSPAAPPPGLRPGLHSDLHQVHLNVHRSPPAR